jgi:hypothetical protein
MFGVDALCVVKAAPILETLRLRLIYMLQLTRNFGGIAKIANRRFAGLNEPKDGSPCHAVLIKDRSLDLAIQSLWPLINPRHGKTTARPISNQLHLNSD